jgi:hypothetical protein
MDFIVRRAIEYPGSNILIARATLTSLKDSTLQKFEQRYGWIFDNPEARQNWNEGRFVFPTAPHALDGKPVNSTMKAIGLDRADLEQVLRSTEFSTVLLEEADEIDSDAHDIVQGRSRQQIFHRSKKVHDLCHALAQVWGIHFEEVFEILKADKRHPVGQRDLELDDPMPGNTVVKALWNPKGDDAIWQRYVGVPYPEPEPSPDWVKKHIGIREVHVTPERVMRRRTRFVAGTIVKLLDGTRRYAARHEEAPEGGIGTVHLVRDPNNAEAPMSVSEDKAGLIVQRNCIYAFPWENESRDFQNDIKSWLMVNQGMADRAFLGTVDKRSGRVFPGFVADYSENGGHLLRYPGREVLARRSFPGVGGLDQGGRHATAAGTAIVTPETQTTIVYNEYCKTGKSAAESAQEVYGMILPGMQMTWGYDPQMNAKRYDRDTEYATIDEYKAVLGDGNMFNGIRGDAGFELVNRLLMPHENFRNGGLMPRLMVFDNCHFVVEAMTKLTWKMVDSQRDNYLVDIGDMIKFLVSVIRMVEEMAPSATEMDMFKPRLAYSTRD